MLETRVVAALRRLKERTQPVDVEVERHLRARWAELPEPVRTPSQLVGRKLTGCEGTHGVFPACNMGCEPCYHGAEANRVPVDPQHTLAEVDRQMAFLQERRGPGQYAQLIGGEVSLLPPQAHAEALGVMRGHGRIPMSFSHGDFDLDYLEKLALDDNGAPRFDSISFAVHVDSTMRGRRSVKQPASEAELDDERARIARMFDELRRRHGVRSYVAHSMTVTPANLGEVAHVVRVCRQLGYRMNSFQPAAYVGDHRRWDGGYDALTDDAVWGEVESGVGRSLPFGALQVGDVRCNRMTWGLWVGDRYVPILEDGDRRDEAARDAYLRTMPSNLRLDPWPVKLARIARSLARAPRDTGTLLAWLARLAARGSPGLRHAGGGSGPRIHATTYVMHHFMDAADVARAWDLMQRGETATDPTTAVTQERLAACVYEMAHPETGEIVPACVQHSVLDQRENQQLIQLLPRRRTDR